MKQVPVAKNHVLLVHACAVVSLKHAPYYDCEGQPAYNTLSLILKFSIEHSKFATTMLIMSTQEVVIEDVSGKCST